jgi:hypothetical protein
MPDVPPNPELLPSLGRLARGLSALFWGLPAALIICVGTATAGWFKNFGVIPPLIATGLLLFGLWQLSAFQKQERPWRAALDRAKLLALVNCVLSPFLFWWSKLPGQPVFALTATALAFSGLLFLASLNSVIARLGAMLPDETLRHETRSFTALNRGVLLVIFVLAALYYLLNGTPGLLPRLEALIALRPVEHRSVWFVAIEFLNRFGVLTFVLLVLPPLSLTMALLWKTKEVILESVFGSRR